MAEFPPNLDDDELWLPSDMFLNEVHPFHCPCMNNPAPNSATVVHRFPPRNCFRPPRFSSKSYEGFIWSAPPVRDELTIPNRAWPLAPNRTVKPARPQVDNFQEIRRVLQRPQNRVQNLLLPFRGSGFLRESAGTGVFHPRASTATTTFSTADDFSTELYLRNRHENRVFNQRSYSISSGSMYGDDEDEYQSPEVQPEIQPEMLLPRDWTY